MTEFSLPVLVRVVQRNRNQPAYLSTYLPTYLYREWLGEICSRDYRDWEVPWSAICKLKPGKLCGVIQSESEGLTTRGAAGVNPSPRSGEDEMRFPRLEWRGQKKGEGYEFLLPLPLLLLRPSTDWRRLTHIGEGSLLYWVYQFKCQSYSETPSWTSLGMMFNLFSGPPVAQAKWHIKLTILPPTALCHGVTLCEEHIRRAKERWGGQNN